jgi:hypothetical protein
MSYGVIAGDRVRSARLRVTVAGVSAATVLAACTSGGNPKHSSAPAPSTHTGGAATQTSAPPPAATCSPAESIGPLGAPPCVVPLPAAWRRAIRRGQLWHGVWDRHPTAAPSPDGSGVLLQQDDGKVAHIVLAGAGHKTVTRVGDVPNPTGQGQVTFAAAHSEFAYGFRTTTIRLRKHSSAPGS